MISTSALLPLILTVSSFQPSISHRLDSPNGATVIRTGVLSAPLEGRLGPRARAFALANAKELKLPASSTLSEPEAFGTRFGATFRMNQLVDGVPVQGAVVTVTIDANRRVVQLSSSIVPYSNARRTFAVSPEAALHKASFATMWAMRTSEGVPYGGVKRMFFAVGDEVRAGYLIWVPTLDLTKNWYLSIDAANGEILRTVNRAFHAAADADVYVNTPGGLQGGVGVTPTQRVTLSHFGPEHATTKKLSGDQLVSWNCCVNEGCSTDPLAKPKRAKGTTTALGFPVNYDVAVCDRQQRATNDSAVHASGDFVYAPVDPPNASSYASQSEPADTDEFSEVHAFYHLNNVYDFVRGLSTKAQPLFPDENIPGFQTRDEKVGKRIAVWSNVLLPDFAAAQQTLGTGTATAHDLVRTDNAAYMPKENFDSLVIPELSFDSDALMMFQGSVADFGYDAPVYWHEFGHGVIFATAAFESFTLDARSGNNEGGALHEAISDYFAAAFQQGPVIGEYVGPRLATMQPGTAVGLRNLKNTFACPDVLQGQVHNDSQHFSAALWDARMEIFQGQDMGDTFDAAFYGSLVSMTPATGFEQAALIVSSHVGRAFPNIIDAQAKMEAIFTARGVLGCSKVLDVTGDDQPRTYYGIGGTQAAGVSTGAIVPGPYQMKLHAPKGVKSLTVSLVPTSQGPFGGMPAVRLLTKMGEPVTFTRSGAQLQNDADEVVSFTSNGQGLKATAQVEVPCGADLYFTLGSASQGGDTVANVSVSHLEADSCPTVDAGTPEVDAGTQAVIPAVPDQGNPELGAKHGCGCTAVDPSLALFGLIALGAVARRRRHR